MTFRTLATSVIAALLFVLLPAPANAASLTTWNRLAMCESSGRWHVNTGNGYYGGLQFNLGTWHSYGGSGYPHRHSKSTQIRIAQRVLHSQGWGAWPACSRKIGVR